MKSSALVSNDAIRTESEELSPQANTSAFSSIKTPLIFIAIFAGIAFAYLAWPVVLPFMLAWVASMTLKPPVSWLRTHHFPHFIGSYNCAGLFHNCHRLWDDVVGSARRGMG